jgi:hypothetical protein
LIINYTNISDSRYELIQKIYIDSNIVQQQGVPGEGDYNLHQSDFRRLVNGRDESMETDSSTQTSNRGFITLSLESVDDDIHACWLWNVSARFDMLQSCHFKARDPHRSGD